MKRQQAQNIADIGRMLGDPTRVSILAALAKGPKSVGMLCRVPGLRQPTASHHLALLRVSSLVVRERKGKQMFYSLNLKSWTPLKKFLAQLK